jgi:hypothetical protein
VEGKAWVRVDAEPDGDGKCKVVIGCDVPGKWVLHWGVSYDGETGRYARVVGEVWFACETNAA